MLASFASSHCCPLVRHRGQDLLPRAGSPGACRLQLHREPGWEDRKRGGQDPCGDALSAASGDVVGEGSSDVVAWRPASLTWLREGVARRTDPEQLIEHSG